MLQTVAAFNAGVRVGSIGPTLSVAQTGAGDSVGEGKTLAESSIAVVVLGEGGQPTAGSYGVDGLNLLILILRVGGRGLCRWRPQ